jgi:DNA-binding MltR family transcriptional regulator
LWRRRQELAQKLVTLLLILFVKFFGLFALVFIMHEVAMPWILSSDAHRIALEEIEQTKSDRATAIVGATLLENDLRNAIEARLLKNANLINKLFKPTGPLGPFQTKADLALLLGVFDDQIHADLTTIISIRNLFAHNIKPLKFNSKEISKLCSELRVVEHDPYPQIPGRGLPDELRSPQRINSKAPPRDRFLLAIKLIVIALWAASHDLVIGPDGMEKKKWGPLGEPLS